MNKISSADYVRNFSRDNDYNLYLVHFFMPIDVRYDALALMALHAELKTIPVKARDPSMIVIRLKWWYDNAIGIFDGQNHADSPVLDQLQSVIKKHDLTKHDFETYFNAFTDQTADQDAELYVLLDKLINNKKDKKRFSKILQHHDRLAPDVPFRALRLWTKQMLT